MIKFLFDDVGNKVFDHTNLERLISAFYHQLFTTSSPTGIPEALEGVEPLVTELMTAALDCDPTEDEIREALFQMHPTKAPGTDGMHAIFFQKFWDIIANDVISLIHQWWRGLVDLTPINKTYVYLIPKVKDPAHLSDFRPISCCNVLYKIISIMMANRLNPFLSDLISVNQSAFIPKRLITDNALITFETFDSMNRRNNGRHNSLISSLI